MKTQHQQKSFPCHHEKAHLRVAQTPTDLISHQLRPMLLQVRYEAEVVRQPKAMNCMLIW